MEATMDTTDEVRHLRREIVRLETTLDQLLDILGRGLYPAEVEAKVRELHRSLSSDDSRVTV